MTSLKFLLLALVVLVISTGGAYCRYLSDEDKDQILWAHNHYRRSVQPQATNMNELVRTYSCKATTIQTSFT